MPISDRGEEKELIIRCTGGMADMGLITNLSNYIQPFIRYELTDSGKFKHIYRDFD